MLQSADAADAQGAVTAAAGAAGLLRDNSGCDAEAQQQQQQQQQQQVSCGCVAESCTRQHAIHSRVFNLRSSQ
jgi:hypothetical protein